MKDINAELTQEDQHDYDILKTTVHQGLDAWYEAGLALRDIHERRLWRDEYHSFSEFCSSEYHDGVRRCYQHMQASEVVDMLPGIELNEGQALALARASVEHRSEIIETVIEQDGKLTIKKIEKARRDLDGSADKPFNQEMFIREVCRDLDHLATKIESVLAAPEAYPLADAWQSIKNQKQRMRSALMSKSLTHDCPYCGNKPKGCKYCNGTGRVTKAMHQSRDAVLP